MKMEATGGGFRIRVSSTKTYSLINYDRGGRITLTELGTRALDPNTQRAARVEAFLKVPLYAKVYESFKGRPLPPQAGLERAIVQMGVGAKVAEKARQVMMRAAKQAGFFELSADRLTEPPLRDQERLKPPLASAPTPPTPPTYGGGNNGGEPPLHPLIQGLLLMLPRPPAEWSAQDRYDWLVMAQSILKNVYKKPDDIMEVEIKLVQPKGPHMT
jgi:hypothetical protein